MSSLSGQIAYWGPISDALPYFKALGYDCPAAYSAAEFLAEVVHKQTHHPTTHKTYKIFHNNTLSKGISSPCVSISLRLLAPLCFCRMQTHHSIYKIKKNYITTHASKKYFVYMRINCTAANSPAELLSEVVACVQTLDKQKLTHSLLFARTRCHYQYTHVTTDMLTRLTCI